MHTSQEEIDAIIKQANILGRVYRGTTGALKGAPKGALIGGLVGAGLTAATGGGLAAALGVGGKGLMSGAMAGGGIRGAIGGLRGLLSSKGKQTAKALSHYSTSNPGAIAGMKPMLPLVGGAGLGYALAGEDSKVLGTGLGAAAGLMARPAIMKALAKRAGGA